jgi:alkanesulfonate monooxygenase SsuD/methylene tetrahydromethanopterin reductase-like flavin-dependent oxidoreductase (luciferase family)
VLPRRWALRPLLDGDEVAYRGETLTAAGRLDVPDLTPPPLIISALGPVMLRLAGELADGTVTTWTGARAIAEHIVPGITKAAQAAGRPSPRVLAGVVIALTDDPDRARAALAERLGFAAGYPSYRANLDRQGLAGVHETIIAGNERQIAAAVREFEEAGATDLLASPLDNERETLALLASLR